MGTRSMYTFIGDKRGRWLEQHHVYKHFDGYPLHGDSGAVIWIKAALDYAWPLPRYEADDFAAAFVAANKRSGEAIRKQQLDFHRKSLRRCKKEGLDTAYDVKKIAELTDPGLSGLSGQGGDIRLMNSGQDWRTVAPWDIEYRYEIQHMEGEDDLTLRAYRVNYDSKGDFNTFVKENWSQELLFTTGLRHADVQAKLWLVHDEQQAA
jgi:hypothetical protein